MSGAVPSLVTVNVCGTGVPTRVNPYATSLAPSTRSLSPTDTVMSDAMTSPVTLNE